MICFERKNRFPAGGSSWIECVANCEDGADPKIHGESRARQNHSQVLKWFQSCFKERNRIDLSKKISATAWILPYPKKITWHNFTSHDYTKLHLILMFSPVLPSSEGNISWQHWLPNIQNHPPNSLNCPGTIAVETKGADFLGWLITTSSLFSWNLNGCLFTL